MRLEPRARLGWLANEPMRLALSAWALILVIVSVRSIVQPQAHSCYPIFASAARHWRAGEDLYYKEAPAAGALDCYRYSPLVAALLTPLSIFPDGAGGILWRLVSAAALLAGLAWCYRGVLPHPLSRGQQALLVFLVLPLAIGNLNNAQANALVLGLMLATVAAGAEQRWNVAAVCLALACLVKLYPIALGLLLVLLYPRQFAGRLLAALAVGAALPFLLQRPDYVTGQYADWLNIVARDDRHARVLATAYRDFLLVSRMWFAPFSLALYRVVEAATGIAMAVLCLAGRWADWPARRLLTFLLGLACCWMTVFGPATESCTYILIAPTLAYLVIESWALGQPGWLRGLAVAIYALLLASYLEDWFPSGNWLKAHGVQPLAGLLLIGNLIWTHFARMPASLPEQTHGVQAACAPAA
ncbi:MAG: DUF2029 domain-containing protein [Planctomycetota bacterium]|nr:MAG: DUF2029 domain-containing protein [Planctomycetota bacterium]